MHLKSGNLILLKFEKKAYIVVHESNMEMENNKSWWAQTIFINCGMISSQRAQRGRLWSKVTKYVALQSTIIH